MSTTEPATAEDHIREAERLLDAANRRLAGNDAEWLNTPLRRAEMRAEAAVRATLAQTLKSDELLRVMAPLAEWVARPDAGPGCSGTCECGGSPHGDRS